MPTTAIDIDRAIEVAEHNGSWGHDGKTLVVFDTTGRTAYGIRIEVSPGATAVGGWIGRCYDTVGNRCTKFHADRCTAARNAYLGYCETLH